MAWTDQRTITVQVEKREEEFNWFPIALIGIFFATGLVILGARK